MSHHTHAAVTLVDPPDDSLVNPPDDNLVNPPDDTPDDSLVNPPDDMTTMADNPDPLETGNNDKPVFWKDPQHITIGLAAPGSPVGSVTVTDTLNSQEITLLKAATQIWESVANVEFEFVNASPSVVPDISVGLADLDSLQFIGYTHYNWNQNNELQKAQVVIEDPKETPITALADGNLRYTGFTTTVLQDFIHELGHALGLDHNETDNAAIMHPVIGTADPVPDNNDIAAIQSLYGAPKAAPVMSATDISTLHALVAGTSLSNIA
jgi:hypothetical protein